MVEAVMGASVTERQLQQLWNLYKEGGDREACERLAKAYMPLVKNIARRMSTRLPKHIDEADLFSYGLSGLVKAMERFNPAQGVKFETFATPRVKGAIIDELRLWDWAPRSVRAKMAIIDRANAKLESQLQRAPSQKEIANELGMSVEELRKTLSQANLASVSALDEPQTLSDLNKKAVKPIDTVCDRSAEDPVELTGINETRMQVVKAVAQLPKREKRVVIFYYYQDLTFQTIGRALGVTESRVCQLHRRAMSQLASMLSG